VLLGNLDCADANEWRNPGASEVCDGYDNDCTGAALATEVDADTDQYLVCTGFVSHGAVNGASEVLLGGSDCADNNEWRNPGATEVCDGYDNDCNGATTSGSGETDPDLDRYIACSSYTSHGASNSASQTILGGGDCLDVATTTNSWSDDVRPGATEVCDSWDSDCSTAATPPAVPSGAPEASNEIDNDGDNYIDCTLVASVVTRSPVVGGSDCNDGNSAIFPTAVDNTAQENVDNDCDGLIDEAAVVVGDLVVNEFLARPQTGPDEEYIELYNTTSRTLRLVGWRITDGTPSGESYTIPALTVAAGGYVVLCRNETTADGAGCANVGSPMSSFGLAWPTDTIQVNIPDLVSPLTVDTVAYTTLWNELPHKAVGLSVDIVVSRHSNNDNGGNWCNQLDAYGTSPNKGTPGGPNNTCDNALRDEDGDGYCPSGQDLNTDGDCSDGIAESDAPGECDDTNPYRYPGNAEVCDGLDNDCAGAPAVPAAENDEDLDTYIECTGYIDHDAVNASSVLITGGGDCLDVSQASNSWSDNVNPAATELCDGWDTNCTNLTGSPDLANEQDQDGDGYVDCGTAATGAVFPSGILGTADCLDVSTATNSWSDNVNPGASELCDGWDTNCSVFANAGAPDQANEVDDDGDGYIDCGSSLTPGAVPPAGITNAGDCVDTAAGTWSASIKPSATEVCDSWDTNCTVYANAGAPDAADEIDDDGDGKIPCTPIVASAVLRSGITGGGDCLDVPLASNSWSDDVKPGATEVCDGWDTNCTSAVNGGAPDQSNEQDQDGDTYIDCAPLATGAVLPVGITGVGDCVDVTTVAGTWADDIRPGATEVCDGWDTNCSVFATSGAPDQSNEQDQDGDGYIDCSPVASGAVFPTGIVGVGDCLDVAVATNSWSDNVNPAASEVCDGWDTNCSVFASAGAPDQSNEQDQDGDTYIDCSPVASGAVFPAGVVGVGDCLDVTVATNSWSDNVNPGASEVCDSWDTNCTVFANAGVPTAANEPTEIDDDGDTYMPCASLASGAVLRAPITGAGDCLDELVATNSWSDDVKPGATEVCDSWDTNCTVFANAGVPTAANEPNEIDDDGDTFLPCSPLASGAVLRSPITGVGDCLDVTLASNSWSDDVKPGATEVCDSWDTNCSVFANAGVPTAANEPTEVDDDGDNYIPCSPLASGAVLRSPITGAGDCLDELVASNSWSDNVNPGATEVCDSWDTNCTVFANAGAPTAANEPTEIDDDGDTYMPCASLASGAVLRAPITGAGDCLDELVATNSWSDDVKPGATEVCDSWDTNCTVFANAGVPTAANEPNEIDDDGDTFLPCSPLASGAVLRSPITGAGDCLDEPVASNSWSDNVNPGAAEVCDSWDTNCTVFANAGVPTAANEPTEIDDDGDNYLPCSPLASGAVLRAPIVGVGDCLDELVTSNSWSDNVNPGASEVCDSWDTNCTVFANAGVPSAANEPTEIDDDGDNYLPCSPVASGAVLRAPIVGVGDCLDELVTSNSYSDNVNPGVSEACDSWDTNCTVFANAGVPTAANEPTEIDDDGDNYLPCSPLAVGAVMRSPIVGVADCLDVPIATNAYSDDVRPGATEVCDSWDTNCTIFANSGVPTAANEPTEIDDDGDTFMPCASLASGAVLRAPITGAGDCLDETPATNSYSDDVKPGATEVCDSWDTNCSTFANAGVPTAAAEPTEIDDDGDNYLPCSPLAAGAVLRSPIVGVLDCLDVAVATNAWSDNVNPSAAELCDGWDTNCTVFAGGGAADLANEQDGDGDGHVECGPEAASNVRPAGVTGFGDCNDLSSTVRVGLTVPEAPGSAVLAAACADADSDGYCLGGGEDVVVVDGDCSDTGEDYESRMAAPAALAWADCDDTVAGVGGTSEALIDSTDNDSDGFVDEGCIAAGFLIVTEIHSDDTDADPDQLDWYEVWNAAWHDVCVDGWTVVDDATDTYTIPNAAGGPCGRLIEPRTRAILSESDYTVLGSPFTSGGDPLHVWGGASFSIEDVGSGGNNDAIELRLGALTVDVVLYNPSWPDPAAGTSLELGDGALPTNPSATVNDASASWCVATGGAWANGTATPGTANGTCP
jgi:hypothetical protein